MQRFLVLYILILIPGSLPLQAQQAAIKLHADSLTAGQTFELSLRMQQTGNYDRIIYPDSAFFPESLGFRSSQTYKQVDGSDSVVYHLQFFAIQDVTLSPLPVRTVIGSDTSFVYTDPVLLPYKPTLDPAEAELKPIKPIFSFPGPVWPWILGALLLASLAFWLWYRQKRLKQTEPAPSPAPSAQFEDPLLILEQRLKQIEKESDLSKTADFKSYYSDIGDAIRQYFEELYDIPALESTSRELFRYLDAFGVDPDLIKFTRQILSRADMVKFAKFTPTLESALSVHVMASNFAERAASVDMPRIERLRKAFEEKHGDIDPVHKMAGTPEVIS